MKPPRNSAREDAIITGYKMFLNVGQRMLGNAYSDDVAQDTVLRLIEKAGKVEDPSELGRYGYRVAKNFCLDAIRRGKRAVPGGIDSVQQNAPRAKSEDPALSALCSEILACLDERQRTINKLHYWEGYTTAEIGSQLGMTAGHVQVVLHRSREKMRAFLEC